MQYPEAFNSYGSVGGAGPYWYDQGQVNGHGYGPGAATGAQPQPEVAEDDQLYSDFET